MTGPPRATQSAGMIDSGLFTDAKNLDQLLDKTPWGRAAAGLCERIGLLTPAYRAGGVARRPFPTDFSSLSDRDVSKLLSYFVSELGRVSEIVGILSGQERLLGLELKRAQARARARARREAAAAGVKVTLAELDDVAASDPTVVDLEDRLAALQTVLVQAQAVREVTLAYQQAISREITFRTEMAKLSRVT